MNVRVFNSQSSANFAISPGRFAMNPPTGTFFQDVPEADAAAMVSMGFVPTAYVGTTGQRPARIAENALGLNVFIDTTLSKAICQDGSGVWRDITSGTAV
jgi:hypothetical protein